MLFLKILGAYVLQLTDFILFLNSIENSILWLKDTESILFNMIKKYAPCLHLANGIPLMTMSKATFLALF